MTGVALSGSRLMARTRLTNAGQTRHAVVRTKHPSDTASSATESGSATVNKKDKCICCQHVVTSSDKGIQCDLCDNWFHAECQEVKDSSYNALIDDQWDNQLIWYCKCCKKVSANIISKLVTLEKEVAQMKEHQLKDHTAVDYTRISKIVEECVKESPAVIPRVSSSHADNFRKAIPDAIRIRGIPEPDKDIFQNTEAQMKSDKQSVERIFEHIAIDCDILDLKRLGSYDTSRSRPLLVTVNPWKKRLILSSLCKLKNYEHRVFLSRDLSSAELRTEKALLKKRFDLITKSGVSRKDLKLINLNLQQKIDDVWVPVKD